MAFKLHQRGILTVDTVIWLASSLPANFIGGLGALGGVALQTTATMVGGAATVGNTLVGTATGLVGNTSKTVAEGIGHLKPGVVATEITHVLSGGAKLASDQATSITSAGSHGAAVLAEGTSRAISGSLSLVNNSETAVKENISHLISGEHAISPGHIAINAVHTLVDNTSADTTIGATKAVVTENTTKLAHGLDSVNPLHLHIMSTESQDAQVCVI